MSNDSFIREVNEELRQDQLRSLWQRFGSYIIGAAVLVVLATAAFVGYEQWTASRANHSGDLFARALELSEQGRADEALDVFAELESAGYGAYPILARMRAAAALVENGEVEEAIAKLDAVANDRSAPGAIQDIARIRAALLLVDHGSYADVAARVEALTADTNPMRHSAREALGLAAWKEGNRENAMALFGQILDDMEAPAGVRRRAEMMSDLIAGSASVSG